MPERSFKTTKQSYWSLPIAQRPRSIEILRFLIARPYPTTIKDIAIGIATPEITARNRIYKLVENNCIEQVSDPVALGLPVNGPVRYYQITQYGRDCANSSTGTQRPKVNSIFALAGALERSE